jgi:TrmH family RNA methyltransferase
MFSKSHTKYIQSLHHKKFRDELGVFIAEGPKLVEELLQSPGMVCKSLFALNAWLEGNEQMVAQKNIESVYEVEDFELEKISALATPHLVLGVFEQLKVATHPNLQNKISLALDTIQDPGNLGTIIRIADWFGIEQIICSIGSADQYNPKVVQSTMGSLARVNLLYVDLLTWLPNQQLPIYAAALNGKPMQELGAITEGILLIGNESKGIHPSLLDIVTEKITIPKKERQNHSMQR